MGLDSVKHWYTYLILSTWVVPLISLFLLISLKVNFKHTFNCFPESKWPKCFVESGLQSSSGVHSCRYLGNQILELCRNTDFHFTRNSLISNLFSFQIRTELPHFEVSFFFLATLFGDNIDPKKKSELKVGTWYGKF